MQLIDRLKELEVLQSLADAKGPRLVLVHGRRRVGKTFLLQNAWGGRRAFYFLAARTTAEQNRVELLQELERWTGRRLPEDDYRTWRTVFRLLGELAGPDPLIVVLDEFQYLLEEEGVASPVVSMLSSVWDSDLQGRNLTLVICGSEVGTMQALGRQGALFGRLSREIHLNPFDYRDASAFLPQFGPRERALLYGVFGGTPAYLTLADEYDDLAEYVSETFLETGGTVHLQVANLIEQEEGIRDTAAYRAILSAIANGRTELNDIAGGAGMSQDTAGRAATRRIVDVLLQLSYVRRERNFDAGRTAAWRYHLSDNAVKFWYRYVHRFRSLLQIGSVGSTWDDLIAPDLDDYMGWEIFEDMAHEALVRHHDAWNLAPPAKWSRWVGRDRQQHDIEIDIVAELANGRILTGEVKWSSRPVSVGLHTGLLGKLNRLAASGFGWARRALSPDTSAGHLYVSAAGFDEGFYRLASDDHRLRLIDLEDMYA